jgi:hypothetical protein
MTKSRQEEFSQGESTAEQHILLDKDECRELQEVVSISCVTTSTRAAGEIELTGEFEPD